MKIQRGAARLAAAAITGLLLISGPALAQDGGSEECVPTSSEVCQPEECVPTSSELCQPEEDVGGQALEPDDEPAPQPPAEEELPATGLGILPIVATGAGIATAGVGVTIFARRRRT